MKPSDPESSAAMQQNPEASETAHRFALCYERLHTLAAMYFRRERNAWTLQPTALVHEAYLRLAPEENRQWRSRAQFLAFAARAMRQVLVDLARAKGSLKRSPEGGAVVTLVDAAGLSNHRSLEVLDLDVALERLRQLDPRKATIVELRFFGGMSVTEVGEALEVSEATVFREWRTARAWLSKALEREPASSSP